MWARKDFLKWLAASPFLFEMTKLQEIFNLFEAAKNTTKMPLLFLGHGNPMNAIEDNQFVQGFKKMAQKIPRPEAILCVSAHWFTKGTKVTGIDKPPVIYDFYGFPEELYKVKYPAIGSPVLAETVKQLIKPTETVIDKEWGLDHGAWSVLTHFFPNADVPVIQMSIDQNLSTKEHFELGKKLSSLRKKGVLIIGSGNIVHNLSLVDFNNFHKDNYGYDWAIEARSQINDFILSENYNPLFQYRTFSKAFQNAIPTPEHFLPLMYILSLKEKNETIHLFNDKLLAGSLSMTSLYIH
jgi:4,5-DOPA dioxygenase extradiol